MVLIINGEVVPDSDPRAVKARGGAPPSSSFPSSSAGLNQRRPPATIHGDDDSSNASSSGDGAKIFQGKAYSMSGGAVKAPLPRPPPPSSSSTGAAAPLPGGGTYYPSPPLLQQAAEALGTQGRMVTIPAVPFLGLSASTFDLLPCLGAALALLYFGWRGVGVLAVLYVFIKKSQDPPPRVTAAGRGRGRGGGQ